MKKYIHKYKRIIVSYFANLDLIPETKTIRRMVRQEYIRQSKPNFYA